MVSKLIRKNIVELVPYVSARDEFSRDNAIFLDANENPYESGANRYPDPLQTKLKVKISQLKNIPFERIFIGNGSDEAIDLLIKAFCEPGTDNIVSIKPTYGMYKVCANVNNVEFREVLLNDNYQINKEKILKVADQFSKLLFLCSPNNPTSNSMYRDDIIYLLEAFNGLVVLDEAYIDFSVESSFLTQLENYPNLVVLQTLSKAWGMAGIRLGMAFADREIINVLNKIKYPYNINILSQRFALKRLSKVDEKDKWVKMILEQREKLRIQLMKNRLVDTILPSDANFLMVRFRDTKRIFNYLTDRKIIVRDRSKVPLCEDFLRITVGTPTENDALIQAIEELDNNLM